MKVVDEVGFEVTFKELGNGGDRRATKADYLAILDTDWAGEAAPYTKEVTVTGILPTDEPHITPIYSDDNTAAIAEKEAWSCISKAEAAENKLIFTCFEDMPETALNLQVEVIR